jgi:hypothetical protein
MAHAAMRLAAGWVLSCGVLIGCGSESSTAPSAPSGPEPISFSRSERWCSPFNPGVLTVSALLGPRGSTTSNTLPGTYVARGAYNLTGTGVTGGTIEVGFLGSVVTGEGGQSVQQHPYVVPAGMLSGTYEASGGFLRRTSGPGTPLVDLVSGSSVIDCVALY